VHEWWPRDREYVDSKSAQWKYQKALRREGLRFPETRVDRILHELSFDVKKLRVIQLNKSGIQRQMERLQEYARLRGEGTERYLTGPPVIESGGKMVSFARVPRQYRLQQRRVSGILVKGSTIAEQLGGRHM